MQLHQIALTVTDLERSVAFYQDILSAKPVAEFTPPGIAFFMVGDVRLLLQRSETPPVDGTALYFRVDNIYEGVAELEARGVNFETEPHMIHRDDNGTFGKPGEAEWMTFFRDPDGNLLALVSRVAA